MLRPTDTHLSFPPQHMPSTIFFFLISLSYTQIMSLSPILTRKIVKIAAALASAFEGKASAIQPTKLVRLLTLQLIEFFFLSYIKELLQLSDFLGLLCLFTCRRCLPPTFNHKHHHITTLSCSNQKARNQSNHLLTVMISATFL